MSECESERERERERASTENFEKEEGGERLRGREFQKRILAVCKGSANTLISALMHARI